MVHLKKSIWNIWYCYVLCVLDCSLTISTFEWQIINTKIQNAEANHQATRERKQQKWLWEQRTSEYTTTRHTHKKKPRRRKKYFKANINNLFQFTVLMWINYLCGFVLCWFFFHHFFELIFHSFIFPLLSLCNVYVLFCHCAFCLGSNRARFVISYTIKWQINATELSTQFEIRMKCTEEEEKHVGKVRKRSNSSYRIHGLWQISHTKQLNLVELCNLKQQYFFVSFLVRLFVHFTISSVGFYCLRSR